MMDEGPSRRPDPTVRRLSPPAGAVRLLVAADRPRASVAIASGGPPVAGRSRSSPLTYHLEFRGTAGTILIHAALAYLPALRWAVRLSERLRRAELRGELRVIEDAFGTLVARRRIRAPAAAGFDPNSPAAPRRQKGRNP